jgi:hypothetical protein
LPGADQYQPPRRTEYLEEVGTVETKCDIAVRRVQAHFAGGETDTPGRELAHVHNTQNGAQRCGTREPLHHEIESPSARQAEAMGLLGRDAVTLDSW